MSIGNKLKINALVVFVGLVVLSITTYSSFKSLEKEYKRSSELAKTTSILKSMFIGGLLYNSSSGVVQNNPKSQKAKATMKLGVKKIRDFSQKLSKLDSKLQRELSSDIDRFVSIADTKIQKARLNQLLTKKDLKESLSGWRSIKLKLSKNIARLKKETDKSQAVFKDDLSYAITSFMIIAILIVVVLFIVNYILSNSILKPLALLNKATENLKNGADTSSRIEASGDDELAVISKNINSYLDNIDEEMRDTKIFIENTQTIMKKLSQGWFSSHIECSPKNQNLIILKETINSALDILKNRFLVINSTLSKYSKYDYRDKLVVEGLSTGGVFEELVDNINILKDAINNMLVENKINGLTLDNSSDILLKNVDILSNSSNEAAASLEETAAALEQITTNISTNTATVIQMAGYANEVTKSVESGQKLANETTLAMDNINQEVSAISESITVIDQISFQTNILSLNAAVEAATAGEAGKGFAVVAGEVRNLASRSTEAANEIKALVDNATQKADDGKKISDHMIAGYTSLNENISKTLELIANVEVSSKEQQAGIEQINDAITTLDQQTQQNAVVASDTKDVALQTDEISKMIVIDVNKKEFNGKDSVKAREFKQKEHSYNEIKHQAVSKSIQKNTSQPKSRATQVQKQPSLTKKDVISHKPKNITTSSSIDNEWENF
jgi:methyl-accepting chemotaxis protein